MNDQLTLLFDLGGVIMDIRRENAVAALEALGMKEANDFLGEYGQKGPFLALEKGELTPEEFRAQVRPMLRPGVTDAEIDAAFDRFLTGIPVHRLRALERLHRTRRIYMLSNTNAIMWRGKIAEEFRKDGHDMGYYFDGWVPSFEVHAYKPDAEIFRIARERFGLVPERTLFLDDSEANCRAAAALGFRTAHVRPGTEFMDYIEAAE
jgi:HAD hydrolase, family IA, variant 3